MREITLLESITMLQYFVETDEQKQRKLSRPGRGKVFFTLFPFVRFPHKLSCCHRSRIIFE